MTKQLLTCVDDSNRPSDIPVTHWVTEGKQYTMSALKRGANGYYYILEEIDLTPYFPYGGFGINRFKLL